MAKLEEGLMTSIKEYVALTMVFAIHMKMINTKSKELTIMRNIRARGVVLEMWLINYLFHDCLVCL